MMPAKTLVEKSKTIKTLPHIIIRMAQLISNDESTLQDFEEVIRLDPALVARLLSLVNSAYFGLARKIDSISRAVALLGMKNLHNIMVTDATQHIFRNYSGPTEFSPQSLWLHSAASGICCKMIAERIFTLNGDDVYLCGILHDIGLIVIMEADPEMFYRLIGQIEPDGPTIVSLERQFFLTDHCEIGYLLAQEWCLPDAIADAIRNHHPNGGEDTVPYSPTGILQMSEYIVQQLHYPAVKDGVAIHLPPSLIAHIRENIEEYKVLAEDLPEELAKMNSMYGS
ncbi:MAG: HDOD domain-containing protein [Desulfobulbus sp.]|nr:HDOD domain-containing protein [Desulfobulbus sp.]